MFVDLAAKIKEFVHLSACYEESELKWRQRSYLLALALVILPLIVCGVNLLPHHIGVWVQLVLCIAQVAVVASQFKLDIGERILDSAVARKGYQQLAQSIARYKEKHDSCTSEEKEIMEQKDLPVLLIQLDTMADMIAAQVSYAEGCKVRACKFGRYDDKLLTVILSQSTGPSMTTQIASKLFQGFARPAGGDDAKSLNQNDEPQSAGSQVVPDTTTARRNDNNTDALVPQSAERRSQSSIVANTDDMDCCLLRTPSPGDRVRLKMDMAWTSLRSGWSISRGEVVLVDSVHGDEAFKLINASGVVSGLLRRVEYRFEEPEQEHCDQLASSKVQL